MEVIGAIFLIWLVAKLLRPTRCTICSTPFKRTYYKWRIDGKRQFLCPNCNRTMDRRVSDEAMKRF